VMARIRDGLGGDDKMVTTINASIKSMYTALIGYTAANQKKIILDIKAFSACKLKMWKSYDEAIPIEKEFWVLSEIYPKCTKAESKLKTYKTKSDKIYDTQKSALKTKKKLAEVVEKSCTNVCNNKKFETYHEQLDKLAKYYTGCAKKILPKINDLKNATKKFAKVVTTKKLDDAKYLAMRKKCDLIAYRMNGRKCAAVLKLKNSCSFYEACWKAAKKVYDEDVARIKVEEANMKIQWRALVRIQCYLKVLNTKNDKDQKKEKSELDKCIAIKKEQISTKHLDIDYKKVPPKPKCPKDPWCPCTKAYVMNYYKTGPKSRCTQNMVKNYVCEACKPPKPLKPKKKEPVKPVPKLGQKLGGKKPAQKIKEKKKPLPAPPKKVVKKPAPKKKGR